MFSTRKAEGQLWDLCENKLEFEGPRDMQYCLHFLGANIIKMVNGQHIVRVYRSLRLQITLDQMLDSVIMILGMPSVYLSASYCRRPIKTGSCALFSETTVALCCVQFRLLLAGSTGLIVSSVS